MRPVGEGRREIETETERGEGGAGAMRQIGEGRRKTGARQSGSKPVPSLSRCKDDIFDAIWQGGGGGGDAGGREEEEEEEETVGRRRRMRGWR